MRTSYFKLSGSDYVVLSMPGRGEGKPPPLTPAERAVLDLVLQAKSTHDIARARGSSARTVANQLASIFRKTGTGSRAELVALLRRS